MEYQSFITPFFLVGLYGILSLILASVLSVFTQIKVRGMTIAALSCILVSVLYFTPFVVLYLMMAE